MEKSANKKWKESGSTLSFKDWIERENRKKESEGNFIPFIPEPSNTTIQDVINSTLNRSKMENQLAAGYRTAEQADTSKVLGLDKRILVFSTLLIVGSVTYYFYQKLKSKK
jgi:hypothetical protein